jgi:hypothetical protein
VFVHLSLFSNCRSSDSADNTVDENERSASVCVRVCVRVPLAEEFD